MASAGSGYDLAASQFSPEGKVFQIDYAHKAVENSGSVVALKCKDGVVIAVENIVQSKLYEPGSIKRIFNVDKHIGLAFAGFLADAKAVVDYVKKECENFKQEYGQRISVSTLAERVSMYIHAHTLYSAVRPFGVSIILVSYENKGSDIYMIEPSGLYYSYSGCAIGKAKQTAKTELEKVKLDTISMNDLVNEAVKIIYTVHDEIKDKNFEVNVSWIGRETDGVHQLVSEAKLKEAIDFAQKALADADEMDQDI